jgi:serine/threonine-protein kinase
VNELVERGGERPAPPRAPRPGEHVGPYRLVKLLGAGAFGSVFEVEHERLGRRAALKLLDPELGLRPAARARFFGEALSLNRIHNAHIVEVTDVVETAERQALVMELLEGQSLASVMAAAPLPPERFLPILSEVCEALAAAHAAGFVHRDLKPDNIFLCLRDHRADFVKLLDFGLATTLAPSLESGEQPMRARTRPRPFVGTPAYVSPEQASGAPVNHATDIYAVGVILYELVVGRVPFEGESLGHYLVQHASAPVPRLPSELRETELGKTLDTIVQRCMAKDPAARFSSAGELAATFAALGRGELPAVTSVTAARERRRRLPRAAVALAALALASGAAAIALRSRAPETSAPVAAPSRPPAAPAPTAASVTFDSVPPGAEVRDVASGELLGVTPFRRAFAPGAPAVEVELVSEGFVPARRTVTADTRVVRAELVAAPTRRSTRLQAKRPARPLGVEKTIDPFRGK